ncbi:hypothetical protein ACFQX7_35120 [Luedemannella flava]
MCAAVGMFVVIAMVTGLSHPVNRRLLHPDSRNNAHPVLAASLVVVGWYVTLTAVVGILAAAVGLNSENGVATATWYAWLIGGAVAIAGCIAAYVYADRR